MLLKNIDDFFFVNGNNLLFVNIRNIFNYFFSVFINNAVII